MNCYNHPEKEATAICVHCGRGICNECMSPKVGLCMMCYQDYLRGKIKRSLVYLVLLVVIGIIGYYWDPMGKEGLNENGMSCYMLMATCTGIFLITGKLQYSTITFVGSGATDVGILMLLFMLIKLIIAIVLGVLLLPIIIIWQVATIIRNIILLRKTDRYMDMILKV